MKIRRRSIDRCSNVDCTNKSHQGKMELVSLHDLPTASAPLFVVLCFPCASSLQHIFERGEK